MIHQKKKYTKVEILEQSRHLGMALAESETLEAYRSAEEKMANDIEACHLTGIFKKAHREWLLMQQEHPQETEALLMAEEAARQADKTMKMNPLIADYYSAGEGLNQLIAQINQILKHYCLKDDQLPEVIEADSGGCSRCGGCKS